MDFEVFYNSLYSLAIKYTVKKIQSIQDAEDLVCDSFLYCYDHFPHYDSKKASLKTWFFLVLSSRIKNYYRDKKIAMPLEENESLSSKEDDFLIQASNLMEMRQMIANAFTSLPEMQRQIVILRYFYGFDTVETAKRVGIAPGYVRTQLSRALSKMRIYLEKEGYQEE